MIQSEQSIGIDAAIEAVWGYTSDMCRWAAFMPGCRSYESVDDRHSRWTLKVGVGALVRTVRILVHIDEWEGPERVLFSFTLEGDPVKGNGSYVASRRSPHNTYLMLTLHVEGAGPMAPIWEAMSRPLLPTLLRSFCEKLKSEIELSVRNDKAPDTNPSTVETAAPGAEASSAERGSWRRLFGSRAK
jgi:carbon monoxide dehydrogenase subunit G